jgi:hypothetical protein
MSLVCRRGSRLPLDRDVQAVPLLDIPGGLLQHDRPIMDRGADVDYTSGDKGRCTMSQTRHSRVAVAAIAGVFLLLSATVAVMAQENEGAAPGTAVPKTTCLSGLKWTNGNSGSPEMHPGSSCIDCHANGGGPRFIVAGTVYQKFDESNDCYGVEGVVVQLTDAAGKVVRLTTNLAGNFYASARSYPMTMPIKVKIIYKDKERAMATPQSTGNCLTCHTAKGVGGAPGRIIIP